MTNRLTVAKQGSYIIFKFLCIQNLIFSFAILGLKIIFTDHLYNPQFDVAFDFTLFFAFQWLVSIIVIIILEELKLKNLSLQSIYKQVSGTLFLRFTTIP